MAPFFLKWLFDGNKVFLSNLSLWLAYSWEIWDNADFTCMKSSQDTNLKVVKGLEMFLLLHVNQGFVTERGIS